MPARGEVISITDFKRQRRERIWAARRQSRVAWRKAILSAEATTLIVPEVVTFGVLLGAAWALVAYHTPLWQSANLVWVAVWAVYLVAGAVLLHHATERLFGVLATIAYVIAAVGLLFFAPWFAVAMLAPALPLISFTSSSAR